MYKCMYKHMYKYMCERINVWINVCMNICMYKRTYKHMYKCMYKRMYDSWQRKHVEKRDKTCRDTFKILGKKEKAYFLSMIPEVLSYMSQFMRMQSVLRCFYEWLKKIYFVKESSASWRKKIRVTCSFNVLYTKRNVFNYVHI